MATEESGEGGEETIREATAVKAAVGIPGEPSIGKAMGAPKLRVMAKLNE